MKAKNDKGFYCCGFSTNICGHYPNCPENCRQRRRKHPTPAEYKEEYGEEVPDDMPVWVLSDYDSSSIKWELMEYWQYKQLMNDLDRLDKDFGSDEPRNALPIVVACTPFVKPEMHWRPE